MICSRQKIRVAIAFLLASLAGIGCAQLTQRTSPQELQRFEFTGSAMGVEFAFVLYANSSEMATKAMELAMERVQAIDLILSDYKSSSEINQLCRSAPHDEPVVISEELADLLRTAAVVHANTEGAFDVSVGPVSRVWRTAIKRRRLPSDEKVAEALERVGMEHLQLDPSGKLTIDRADMQLDFGGIAKGRAADIALAAFREHGIDSALVDASGDVVVSDPPPGKDGWTVSIPTSDSEDFTILIANQSVATSGDVNQYLEVDGVRHSHIVDPKTGKAITEPRLVTVMHRSGAMADAYASAVSVLGVDGIELATECEFEVQIIVAIGGELTEFETHKSSGFPSEPANQD